MPGYYDIDDILAEEEMVPCQTMFDFSYLSHLNPDTSIISSSGSKNRPKHVLPKDSVFPMPVWAIRNWTDLGFVRITALPKAYRLRAREWLAADPAAVALAPRFFTAGHCLVHLLERSSQKQAQQWKSSSSASAAAAVRKESMHHLENLLQEANALRITLLQTFTGARLQQTLDWALSSVGEDVSAYIHKLTDLEKRLYRCAAVAASNHVAWKLSTSSSAAWGFARNNSSSNATRGNKHKRARLR